MKNNIISGMPTQEQTQELFIIVNNLLMLKELKDSRLDAKIMFLEDYGHQLRIVADAINTIESSSIKLHYINVLSRVINRA